MLIPTCYIAALQILPNLNSFIEICLWAPMQTFPNDKLLFSHFILWTSKVLQISAIFMNLLPQITLWELIHFCTSIQKQWMRWNLNMKIRYFILTKDSPLLNLQPPYVCSFSIIYLRRSFRDQIIVHYFHLDALEIVRPRAKVF